MWIYDYDDNIKINSDQLRISSEWFVNRLEEIYDSFDEISFTDKEIIIEYSWDDYCRGCHMGTINEKYSIPNDIFFSDQSLNEWRENEDALRKKKDEKERVKKEKKEQKRRERREKDVYLKLKKKYEN